MGADRVGNKLVTDHAGILTSSTDPHFSCKSDLFGSLGVVMEHVQMWCDVTLVSLLV